MRSVVNAARGKEDIELYDMVGWVWWCFGKWKEGWRWWICDDDDVAVMVEQTL